MRQVALFLLRMGVWCSRFDEPMLERDGEDDVVNEPTIVLGAGIHP